MSRHSDRRLLQLAACGDGRAFETFYRRHRGGVIGFLLLRTEDPEVAADLASETFAAALVGCRRYRAEGDPAAWLYGIARNKLADARRRGAVEVRARRRLAMQPLELHDDDLDRIAALVDLAPGRAPALDALERLPANQREAVRARMLDELEYPDIARGLRCSEAVVRQRVSRGARALRAELGAEGGR